MFASFIPKLSEFTDDQIIEAGAKFLEKDIDVVRSIVQSVAGQEVLSRIRGKVLENEEIPGVFHRCSECGFAEELFIK